MLLVVEPLTLVIGTICMRVCSHAFSLIVDPLSFIDIAIGMNKLSLSVGLIVAPLAFVATTIWPQLGANAVTLAVQPLSSVGGSIAQREGSLIHAAISIYRLISIVHHTARVCVAFAEGAPLIVSIIIAYSRNRQYKVG